MNPIHLSQAIVHWLEYQSLCGRSELFCEAYLAQPIGEYCLSLRPEHFEPEVHYPKEYQVGTKKKRAMDFAIYGMNAAGTQKAIHHAVEAKFVSAKRDFSQEIYDDLYRLLWFQPSREPESCKRWLVVAGFHKNIVGDWGLGAKAQLGRGRGKKRVNVFTGLLSKDLYNARRTKPISGACPELRAMWVEAAKSFGCKFLPDEITVRLAGRSPVSPHPAGAACYVWEVIRPQPDFAATSPI
jgi:hypothetical protein